MKKYFLPAIAVALMSVAFASCAFSSGDNEKIAAGSIIDKPMTVDQVLEKPEPFVGHQIVIDGYCCHVCSNAGQNLFLTGKNDSTLIRIANTSAFGERFPDAWKGKKLRIKGILREERLDELSIRFLENKHKIQIATIRESSGDSMANAADIATPLCETHMRSHGQSLMPFAESMADFRARAAMRDSIENKPYLQFYYLDADSCLSVQ